MTNREKYNEAFMDSLDVKEEELEGLEYESIPAWDSVGHMTLVDAIETAFDISLETDDVVGLNSYKEGINILKKYDITIE